MAYNLYLLGVWFNQCIGPEPTKEDVLSLFDDCTPERPAQWISPEFIAICKECA